MYKILTVVLGSTILLISCGGGSEKKDDSVQGEKTRLDSLKKQQDKLAKEISSLESDISKKDSTFGVKEKAKLVTLTPVAPTSFTHYIDLQGNVDAVNASNISPRGQ